MRGIRISVLHRTIYIYIKGEGCWHEIKSEKEGRGQILKKYKKYI